MGGGVGIRAGGWKIFQKLISGGRTIIRYSRVLQGVILSYLFKSKLEWKHLQDSVISTYNFQQRFETSWNHTPMRKQGHKSERPQCVQIYFSDLFVL